MKQKNIKYINKFKTGIIGCGRIGSEFDNDLKRNLFLTHVIRPPATEEDIDDIYKSITKIIKYEKNNNF